MYYQNYEDYMRSILGYPVQTNTYNNYLNTSPMQYEYINTGTEYNDEINNLYPEIYKLLEPMICKICEANTKSISKELLEQMTDEIYLNIESDTNINDENIVNIRVNAQGNSNTEEINKNSSSRKFQDRRLDKRDGAKNTELKEKSEEKNLVRADSKKSNDIKNDEIVSEKRQIKRNSTLRDLIKILILNRLLGANRPRPPYPGIPGPRPPRPPYPGRPGSNPRPPYPGVGQGGSRPPIEPRYVI